MRSGAVGRRRSDRGNITIDPKVLVIDGSRIRANAPAGFGGRVTIVADNILVPGAVNAPEVDLSDGLVVVEGAFIDTAPLRERCAARWNVGARSFTGVGRGGLPPTRKARWPAPISRVMGPAARRRSRRASNRQTGRARRLKLAQWSRHA